MRLLALLQLLDRLGAALLHRRVEPGHALLLDRGDGLLGALLGLEALGRRSERFGIAALLGWMAWVQYREQEGPAARIDGLPEGGAALAVTRELVAAKRIPRDARVLVFNTGSGASYRF